MGLLWGEIFHSKLFLAFLSLFLLAKVLERVTYTDPELARAIKNADMIALQVDMTEFREDDKKLLSHYGGTALPFVVLLDANGTVKEGITGMFSASTLRDLILSINAAYSHGEASSETRWSPHEGQELLGRQAAEWQDIEWIWGGPLSLSQLRGKLVLLRYFLCLQLI